MTFGSEVQQTVEVTFFQYIDRIVDVSVGVQRQALGQNAVELPRAQHVEKIVGVTVV